MHQLAFPSSVSNEFGLDFFQWFRELRLQKIVADSAYGFLFLPAKQLRGAAVPRINSTLHCASHDATFFMFLDLKARKSANAPVFTLITAASRLRPYTD